MDTLQHVKRVDIVHAIVGRDVLIAPKLRPGGEGKDRFNYPQEHHVRNMYKLRIRYVHGNTVRPNSKKPINRIKEEHCGYPGLYLVEFIALCLSKRVDDELYKKFGSGQSRWY